jgi:hypothetical protein
MNHFLHSVQNILFDIAIFSWYTLFALTYFEVFKSAPYYLDVVNVVIKLYISLFLILRFNSFRNVVFTNLDKKIIFNGGLYLLFSTILVKIIVNNIAVVSNNADAHDFAKKYVDAH